MRIAICLKAVPQFVMKWEVATARDRISYEAGPITLSEGDETVLEEGLALKTKFGGELVAITVGRLPSQQVLHKALAKGADEAVRVDADPIHSAPTAALLAKAVDKLNCQLVLAGMESYDNMSGQAGAAMAARLGIPFAYGVTQVELGEHAGTIRVTKEIGEGCRQVVEMPLPAVLGIQPGALPITQTSLKRLIQARTRRLVCISLADLGMVQPQSQDVQHFKFLDVFATKRGRQAQLIQGNASEVAEAFMIKIKETRG